MSNPGLPHFDLRTLPLAFSGWLVGVSIVAFVSDVNSVIAGLTLLTAFLLQILSNLANDYGDAVSGIDSDERVGPDRMVQAGAITKKSMGKAIVIFAILSLITGCALLYLAFPNDYFTALVFLLIGLTGIVAAIKYTVGKNPYGYSGFGDLFVFLFFRSCAGIWNLLFAGSISRLGNSVTRCKYWPFQYRCTQCE